MKLLRRAAFVLLSAALLGGLAFGLFAWRGGEWLRAAAEEALQARLLPEVRLGAPVEWQLWPAGRIRLRDLTLRGPDGTPLAAVDEIAIGFARGGLLTEPPRIDAVQVRGVRLKIDIDDQGRPSPFDWLLPAAGDAPGAAPPVLHVDRLELSDIEVLLAYPAQGLRLRAVVPLLVAGPLAVGEAGRLRLEVRAEVAAPVAGELQLVGETTYRADRRGVSLDTLTAVLSGTFAEDWRLREGRLEVAGVRYGVDEGAVLQSASVAAQLDGSLGPVGLVMQVAEAAVGAGGWQASGSASLVVQGVEAELATTFRAADGTLSGDVDGRLAGSALAGRWSWPMRPRGVADLKLTVDEIDLDALHAHLPQTGTDGGAPRWEDWPLTGELRVRRLRLGGLDSRDVRLSLQGAPGER